jgi:hypothetical protein
MSGSSINSNSDDNVKYTRLRMEQAKERCRGRLKEDLGLDEESAEVIMNLLDQVASLQARLHELESAVEIYQAGYTTRLSRYRQVYYEAAWEEVERRS